MGVSAAELIGLLGDSDFFRVMPVFATRFVPMVVIGRLLDRPVSVGVKVRAIHPVVTGTGDNVPKVADHRVDHEQFALIIKVHTPGVRRAMTDDFKLFVERVITPDATIDRRTLGTGGPRFTNERRCHDAVSSIQPAVGTPRQPVDDVVPDRVVIPSVQ